MPGLVVPPGRVRPLHGDGIDARRPCASLAGCERDPRRTSLGVRDPAEPSDWPGSGRPERSDGRSRAGYWRGSSASPQGRSRAEGTPSPPPVGRSCLPPGDRRAPRHLLGHQRRSAGLPGARPPPSTVAKSPARTSDGSLTSGGTRLDSSAPASHRGSERSRTVPGSGPRSNRAGRQQADRPGTGRPPTIERSRWDRTGRR